MLSPFSHLDAVIAGVCLTCHDAGRPEGCRRCARREPVVSAVAGEERVPSPLKGPRVLAAEVTMDGRKWGEWVALDAIRADRSHLASLLDGIRAKHSAGGELDAVGYAVEVMGLVARMGREASRG